MTIDERDEMRRDETNDMNDVMNTRAMRALFQSFRQPRPDRGVKMLASAT